MIEVFTSFGTLCLIANIVSVLTYLFKELTELDPWYNQFKQGKQKVSGMKTQIPGIGLWFRLRANYLEATVTIEDTGIDRIDNFWNFTIGKVIH